MQTRVDRIRMINAASSCSFFASPRRIPHFEDRNRRWWNVKTRTQVQSNSQMSLPCTLPGLNSEGRPDTPKIFPGKTINRCYVNLDLTLGWQRNVYNLERSGTANCRPRPIAMQDNQRSCIIVPCKIPEYIVQVGRVPILSGIDGSLRGLGWIYQNEN